MVSFMEIIGVLLWKMNSFNKKESLFQLLESGDSTGAGRSIRISRKS